MLYRLLSFAHLLIMFTITLKSSRLLQFLKKLYSCKITNILFLSRSGLQLLTTRFNFRILFSVPVYIQREVHVPVFIDREGWYFHSVPDDDIVALSKLKAHADDELNI